MKTSIRIALITIIIVILGSVMVFAGEPIKLQLDGRFVETDVPPIIENGRTLVPYRALLESMGAEVFWEQDAKMATAILGSHRVQVTIDNNTAFVNGITKPLDVPPRIINGRTLIPVRFVLENLNCAVGWDPDTRTVIITSPEKEGPTVIQSISYEETDSSYRIVARGNDVVKNIRTFAYEDPERYGIDILNAAFPEGVGSIDADNEIFKFVRFSQFDSDTVRIVADLNEKVAGKVSLSDDRSSVFIDFDKPIFAGGDVSRGGQDGPGQDVSEDEDEDISGILPELDWRARGKLVAIDAGHGGSDSGATGKINGKVVIMEKDLNLDIALRVYKMLEEAGANVVLLRDRDITMSLYSRPEAANAMNADLLVSIHNNSAETSAPNGVEVLYYDKVGIEAYGITSGEVAAFIQKELVRKTGLRDRGIISAPHLAVLNKSLMPAVIIEGGFLSNSNDLQVMLTEEYREAYAVAAARGIIHALNAWAER
ncbi:MAG: AMIN domain-containing protein [Clostridiales Family XIII bacterium]|nr:AMIN domain-containing protein [Clostridiales Family XIII bacterium]